MDEDSRNPEGRLRTSAEQLANLQGKVRELASEDLLQGASEICIRHGADRYRLRSTSKGKLILTK